MSVGLFVCQNFLKGNFHLYFSSANNCVQSETWARNLRMSALCSQTIAFNGTILRNFKVATMNDYEFRILVDYKLFFWILSPPIFAPITRTKVKSISEGDFS